MRYRSSFILPMLLLATSCAVPSRLLVSQDSLPTYAQAIAKITAKPQQWAMGRCVKNWEVTSEERQRVFASEMWHPQGQPTKRILLEIGNSGFPSYSYIVVGNNRLRSSLQVDKPIAETQISELYRLAFSVRQDETWAQIMDGECYYLTVIDGANEKTILSYGALRSLPQDSLIKKLILLSK